MSTVNGNGATMLLDIGERTFEVELYDTGAARELLACLPQTLSMSRWGDEFYGTLRTKIGHAGDTLRDVFEIGEVAMWPPGGAFCIFFGPTPASARGRAPRSLALRPSGQNQGGRDALPELRFVAEERDAHRRQRERKIKKAPEGSRAFLPGSLRRFTAAYLR